MDWQKLIEAVSSFSIPFLADFIGLPIFFRSWKRTYVVTASMIACAFYAYIRYSNPNLTFISIQYWWVFLIFSTILILLYIFLYTKKKSNPSTNILMTGLILFILLYCSIVVTFSSLFQSFDYQWVKLKVVETRTHKPITGAKLALYFINDEDNTKYDVYEIGKKTNGEGILGRYISKSKLENLKYFDVSHIDFVNIDLRPITTENLDDLQQVTMDK